ncbi:antitermination protein Q [Photorhabdus temperata]|uniref:Phage antitermination protein Q n=1 Tax=Photorhabdus temperata subsp. temperata Meg1 TaxID=1393735 RepID=A0A081RVY3_PHOTE|nr:antiterminator Q family protein [Photorhabdus temperata]KER02836.1 Phage antitermination protein Q [Photorhabdus temperata subsp. temperata Meg1]MCT8348891.1 antitermination protein Q [Photorhabdus temperata]
MRRNIQQVLERWGGWAADDSSGVDFSPIAAGFKGLVPFNRSQRLSCCDADGLVIDICVSRLHAVKKPDELKMVKMYYISGLPKREIARRTKTSEREVRRRMQVAEGFVEGCLVMLDIELEMDHEVATADNLK